MAWPTQGPEPQASRKPPRPLRRPLGMATAGGNLTENPQKRGAESSDGLYSGGREIVKFNRNRLETPRNGKFLRAARSEVTKCGANATDGAKRRLAGNGLFNASDFPCRFP